MKALRFIWLRLARGELVLWTAGAVALLPVLAGCGTSGGNSTHKTFEVTMQSGGTFLVGGRQTALADVAARLKDAGATSESSVRVMVPEEIPKAKLTGIARAIAAGGFPQVVFVKPRQAESFTSERRSPGR
jgi:hypothetical protein